ncbi:major capsid protein [Stutzerimonas nitrititolerans]|uniref:major capsid protein n=1 Tax=Stutzerimonas nitrititolerans TaxID=2482751 RepID=UPI00289F895E|nr:major capsid protein [Stutzerimonas nitrititolerans]
MKMMNTVRKYGRKVAAGSAIALGAVGTAMAEVPADATTALNDAKADGVTIGGIVLGVIIAIAAFKYIRRAL